MNDLLASYLVLSGTLPLRGIGTLYIRQGNAVCDLASKQILPPQHKVHFKESPVTNEEGLINYMSMIDDSSYETATIKLNLWLDDATARLSEHGDVEMPFIGKIFREPNGTISLHSYDSLNLLEPVKAERVVHARDSHQMVVGDRISNSEEMSQLLQHSPPVKYRNWKMAAIVLFAAAVVLILIYYVTGGFGFRSRIPDAPQTYFSR